MGGEDYHDVLNLQVQNIRAAGENVSFLHVDNPYYFNLVSQSANSGADPLAQRLLPLRQQAQSLGLRFGMIINTDVGNAPGPTNDKLFHDDSVSDMKLLASRGVLASGDDVILESWHPYPSTILPETTANTFANAAIDVITAYEQTANAAVPLYKLPPSGFFMLGQTGAVYFSNGFTAYCTVPNWPTYLNMGGNADLSNVSHVGQLPTTLRADPACAEPAGFFTVPNNSNIYQSDGVSHFCGIPSWAQFLRMGGSADLSNVRQLPVLPPGMTLNPPCSG